ncbi:AfsR/SARP family transcriptional regulator [Lacisediminihabitans profunda]|uniref:AfsR/SARP family transcriptional regulator n=1 Tax=Lacisediminihabitans profunda TaxID=2594790 RepID=UPI0016508287|nr:BTAD domain-containing putative transcriptional regulator [Lacisediminihabitans profunda]
MIARAAPSWELTLLNCWQLSLDGEAASVSSRQQRLITALALAGTRSRTYFANLLWPDCSESQAAGSLRASLHAITHQQPGLLHPSSNPLALDPSVVVDVNRVRRTIAEIDRLHSVGVDAIHDLRGADLLPDWYEDWVLFERERLDSQRLLALETLAEHYLAIADIGRALDAASAAVEIEPLRESSHLLLARCHLALGNSAAAMRLYHSLEERLLEEMSIAPSPRFAELLDGVLTSRHARR